MNLRSSMFLLAADPGYNPNQLIKTGLMFVGMLVVFWLMVLQPNRKREKDLKSMLAALRPGDKITTSSGIVGFVLSLKDDTVSIRSSDAKLEVLKSSIAQVKSSESSAA
jgi:preprotein translocase subunit YajC